jgi:hypothetical protein
MRPYAAQDGTLAESQVHRSHDLWLATLNLVSEDRYPSERKHTFYDRNRSVDVRGEIYLQYSHGCFQQRISRHAPHQPSVYVWPLLTKCQQSTDTSAIR